MMSSRKEKNCLNPIDPTTYNKRTSLGKRIEESRKPKSEVAIEMITRALVSKIKAQGLHVIRMLKHMNNTSYKYTDSNMYSLKDVFSKLVRELLINTQKEIMDSVTVSTKKELSKLSWYLLK
ncbi:MAG: hypothetical protein ACI4V7_01645 [Succinivibrionaceae bacterium]